jgi:hypothetical protein
MMSMNHGVTTVSKAPSANGGRNASAATSTNPSRAGTGAVAETRLVVLGFDQGEQFRRVRKPGRELVEFHGDVFEPRTLAPKGLGFVRRIPDRRIAQLVVQLFEALALGVILKGTPSAPSGAPRGPRSTGVSARIPWRRQSSRRSGAPFDVLGEQFRVRRTAVARGL